MSVACKDAFIEALRQLGVKPRVAFVIRNAIDRLQIEGHSPDDLASLIFLARAESYGNGYELGMRDQLDWWKLPYVEASTLQPSAEVGGPADEKTSV